MKSLKNNGYITLLGLVLGFGNCKAQIDFKEVRKFLLEIVDKSWSMVYPKAHRTLAKLFASIKTSTLRLKASSATLFTSSARFWVSTISIKEWLLKVKAS